MSQKKDNKMIKVFKVKLFNSLLYAQKLHLPNI